MKFDKKLIVCGIYKIQNIITGDIYIGSSKNVRNRLKEHFNNLKNNKHVNRIIQNSFNKYGENNFSFELICKCDKSLQYILEQMYLDSMQPYFNIDKKAKHLDYSWSKREGFYCYLKGRTPWNKGIPRTPEEKRYMSERKKEQLSKLSPEEKEANRKRTTRFLKKISPLKVKNIQRKEKS